MPFDLFSVLDSAILKMEQHEQHIARVPSTWPSEASADLLDQTEAEGLGKCRRAVYFRMTGRPETNPSDAMSAQIMRLGRAMETEVVAQMKASDLYVANGIKHWVEDVNVSFEMDAVVLNPETSQGIITEVKSFDGYYAQKQIIQEGKPKLEHVLQLCIYLNEIRTGSQLKDVINKGLDERINQPIIADRHRNRIEANTDNLSQMDNGDLAGKLLYVNRTGRDRREFDVSLFGDADGFHYPAIDSQPWKVFTMESAYDRIKQCQDYWQRSIEEAQNRLKMRGILKPHPSDKPTTADFDMYWNRVAEEVLDLPDTYLPPADFEYRYSPEKVETLNKLGKIPKAKYAAWKKKHAIIGAWQCLLPESPIEMDDGLFISIADTQVGQVTARGEITAKVARPTTKEIVKIKPYNLLPLYLTADHEWKTSDSSFIASEKLIKLQGTKYVPVGKGGGIKEGTNRYKYERPFFHEIVVPFNTIEIESPLSNEELFIIGLWLAEGHYAHRNEKDTKWYKIGFTLNPNETHLADRIKDWARGFTNKDGNSATTTDRVKTDKRTGFHYRIITVNSMDAAAFIYKYAGRGGAKFKSIVKPLMEATYNQQRHLLDGLIEGDGCTTQMRGTKAHIYTSVSKQLALQVQRLLWRQGKVAGIIPQKSSSGFRNGKMGVSYHVRWYDGNSWASRIDNGVFYTAIHSISRNISYTGLVYDLTIKDTHEIPTASGIVHNCR